MSTPGATGDAATNPLATDPYANLPHIDFSRFDKPVTVVRYPRKAATVYSDIDPLKVTAEDLIFGNDLELDGYPIFELPETMLNNGYLGPIIVCPKALFSNAGRLRDHRVIYNMLAESDRPFEVTEKKKGLTPLECACEIVSKHHVPEPRWHEQGHWPRVRPPMAADQVYEVWFEPCEWAKRLFLIGWALQNPHDNNRRWFYRNPDLACLRIHNWVPEKVPMP